MEFNKLHIYMSDKPIATLEWREAPGRTFEVHIDVVPEYEYQRQGIGRQLIKELEHQLSKREPMSLYTFMAGDNEKAKKFFASVGFQLHLIKGFYGKGRDGYFGVKVIGEPK